MRPKPGDYRLARLVRNEFKGLSLVNNGDLVAALPPSSALLAVLSSLLPGGPYIGWTQWAYPPESALLVGAKLLKNVYQDFDSAAVVAYLLSVIATGTLGDVPAHRNSAYLAAIGLRCNVPIPIAALPGEVLGMDVSPPPGIVTLCCPTAIPQVLVWRVVASTGPLSDLTGTWVVLRYLSFSQWVGTFAWGIDLVYVTLSCEFGTSWRLGLTFDISFNVSIDVPACLPLWFFAPDGTTFPGGDVLSLIYAPTTTGGEEIPMPAGAIVAYAGGSAPPGYLVCDGSAVSRTGYANLFAAIGTTWGAGDGSTTFNVPDLRDRVPVGVSPGGLSGRPTARALAAVGGEESHVLIVTELANHTHSVVDPGHDHKTAHGQFVTTNVAQTGALAAGFYSFFTSSDLFTQAARPEYRSATPAGTLAHNTMQPFAVMLWIIAY